MHFEKKLIQNKIAITSFLFFRSQILYPLICEIQKGEPFSLTRFSLSSLLKCAIINDDEATNAGIAGINKNIVGMIIHMKMRTNASNVPANTR